MRAARGSGSSSTVSGYTSGGVAVPAISNIIDKFSFAADGNATDVGDLTTTAYTATGQASTTHGYRAGGYSANVIDKFPFASDTEMQRTLVIYRAIQAIRQVILVEKMDMFRAKRGASEPPGSKSFLLLLMQMHLILAT